MTIRLNFSLQTQPKFYIQRLSLSILKTSTLVEMFLLKDIAVYKSGHFFPIEKICIPFHTIHIDHLGPFVRSKNGNTHILTIVDGFTKYVFVRAVKNMKTKT